MEKWASFQDVLAYENTAVVAEVLQKASEEKLMSDFTFWGPRSQSRGYAPCCGFYHQVTPEQPRYVACLGCKHTVAGLVSCICVVYTALPVLATACLQACCNAWVCKAQWLCSYVPLTLYFLPFHH